jgi:hypothetical protein
MHPEIASEHQRFLSDDSAIVREHPASFRVDPLLVRDHQEIISEDPEIVSEHMVRADHTKAFCDMKQKTR